MTAYLDAVFPKELLPQELFPHFDPIQTVQQVNHRGRHTEIHYQHSSSARYAFAGDMAIISDGHRAMPKIEEIAQANLWKGICLGFTPVIAGIAALADIIHATYQVGRTAQEVYTSRRAGAPKGLVELFNENAAKFDPALRTAATAATIGLLYLGAEATRDPISACIPGFNLGIAVAATVYGLRNPLKFWEIAGRLEKWCLGTESITHKIFGGRIIEVVILGEPRGTVVKRAKLMRSASIVARMDRSKTE